MRCRFERAIFQSQNGFCIFSYQTKDASVPESVRRKSVGTVYRFTAVGYNMPATNAVEVELEGTWQDSKYGLQLAVDSVQECLPTDAAGITAYLSSGLIKGIGPGTAKAIVARFGSRTLEVMDSDPDQLLTVKGIAQKKLKRIINSYTETQKLRGLTTFLAPYGVSLNKIAKIYEEFGDNGLNTVKTDPFQLCRIRGFGFLTVDEIARKTKVSLKNPLRYSGAIQYILDEAKVSGHLFLPLQELGSRCLELLNKDLEQEIVTKRDVWTAIQREMAEKSIYNENGRVYKTFDRQCEVQMAKRIVSMLLHDEPPEIPDLKDAIRVSEQNLKQTLAESQRNAVELCLTHRCAIMTGGPGTGKTTTLRVILDVYHRAFPDNEILLAAPTGKASRRMTEQTGFPASTLHSAMGITSDWDLERDEFELLSADLVIVDECSMVDMRLGYALMESLKAGASLLLVGDPDQLPSVGPGNVLREMIRSELVPTAVLDTVFRQASNSRIALNAYAVNHGDTHLLFGDDFVLLDAADDDAAAKLVMKYYVDEAAQRGIENVQILTPFRKRGAVSSENLNKELREMINPHRSGVDEIKCGTRVFRVGDRIIQTKNKNQVSNGDMGVIREIRADSEDDDPYLKIRMLDGRMVEYTPEMMEDVELAYSITVHKAQGAEVQVAIIPMLKDHYIMLRRNLLYTAISRAKGKVILIGHRQAIYMAIHKNDVDKRNTVLADRISAYYKRESEKRAS